MSTRGALYQKLTGGQNLNIADLLLETGNQNKTVERIMVDCDPTTGPIAITLPEIGLLNGATNLEILVSDSSGRAGANNITVTRGGLSDKVNGTTNAVLNSNFAKAHFLISSVGTAAGWVAFNLSQIVPVAPPTQINERGVVDGAGLFTLGNVPNMTQHFILCSPNVAGAKVLLQGVDYTVAGKIITFLTLAPGDGLNVYYSY